MRPLLISVLFLSVSCSSGGDDTPSTDASIDVATDSGVADSAVEDSTVADSMTIDSSSMDSASSDSGSADSMTIDSSSADTESADTRVDDAGDGGACVSMCSASYCPTGKKCCVEHSGPGGTPCAVCVCLGCACTL